MSNKYSIAVSITPLCPSCGAECEVGLTESRVTGHPIERDDPFERCDRRVFIQPCAKCYAYIGDSTQL